MWRTLTYVGGGLAGALAALGLVFVASMRTKFPPVMNRIRRINRSFTNPKQLQADAGGPDAYASVVHHVGRRSGTGYRTPVVAVTDGSRFLFALPYGPGADWVRNVLDAGGALLQHEGQEFDVEAPRLLTIDEANPRFGRGEQRMHRIFGVRDFLELRRVV